MQTIDIFTLYHNWLIREYAEGSLGLESSRFASFRKKNDLSTWWRFIADRLTYEQKQKIKSLLHVKTLLHYPVTQGEKHFAIDYVNYIVQEKPVIDADEWEEGSREEIEKFLLKHFRLAYTDYIPWHIVFPGNDYALFQTAQNLHRSSIKRDKGLYSYQGFRTRVPGFEYGVLANHCGLEHVPEDILRRIQGSVFVDCGAFIGDSCYALGRYAPGKIFAVEPDLRNLKDLQDNISLNNMDNVIVVPAGVSRNSGEAFLTGEGIGASLSQGAYNSSFARKIPLVTIDALKVQNGNAKIGLIKMDIEGAEHSALEGARKVLREDKPVLSIALYHSGRDFFEIPKFIKSIHPGYKLLLAHTNPLTPIFEEYLIAY